MLKRFITTSLFSRDFILLCLASTAFFASYHLLSPVLPVFFGEHGFDGATVGSLMAVYMLASVVTRPLIGKLADEISKKAMMLGGILVFAGCALLYTLIPDESGLFALRMVHGVAFAVFYTATTSFLVERMPAANKAEGLSYYSNAIKLAMAFSPPLALFLIDHARITQAFWLSSGFAGVALISVLLAGGIKSTAPCVAEAANGVVAEPTRAPKKPKGRLFNKQAAFPGIIMATNSIAFGALIPYIPLLAAEKHLEQAGLFYTVYAFSLIFSRALTGRLSDRYGRASVILPGMGLVILTLLMMSWSPNDVLFVVAAGLYGLSAGTIQPSLMAVAAERTAPGAQGSAMATFTLFIDLGIAAGNYLMGALGAQMGYGATLTIVAGVTACGWAAYFISTLRAPDATQYASGGAA